MRERREGRRDEIEEAAIKNYLDVQGKFFHTIEREENEVVNREGDEKKEKSCTYGDGGRVRIMAQ